MMKHKLGLAAMVAGMLGSLSVTANAGSSPFRAPRIRSRKRYPEQSTRQAMRGHRRAQGGPGLDQSNQPRSTT